MISSNLKYTALQHLECDSETHSPLLQVRELGLDDLQGHLQIDLQRLQFYVLGLLIKRFLKSSREANLQLIKLIRKFLGEKNRLDFHHPLFNHDQH